jgi:hypothetical protein
MTSERKKDLLAYGLLLVLLLILFAKILFTGKIIRAPDITNEFYWGVKDYYATRLGDLLSSSLNSLTPDWNIYINSGLSNEGGFASLQLLVWRTLIFNLIPPPANVAWFIVLHLFIGGAGVYGCCRLTGASRTASFLGGLVFALAPEIVTLINAGHVMKVATIVYAPWAFYFLEKGFSSRRVFYFMATGFVLAFQFFNTHWQIAYYTCLCVGAYGVLRTIGYFMNEAQNNVREKWRIVGLNLVVLVFFLSTVAMSLAPLAKWSLDTNRGAQSGANQGKGGLEREEAMQWSMPPEELATFIVPGLFGMSRQEAGENPANIASYYWGRMVFTQTLSYMGLLPWLLLPLPLLFRRDKYTWLALAGIIVTLLFAMGKYTPFYNFLYDFFPGINRFRVPKMILFIPVIGLGVLAARGFDLLMQRDGLDRRLFDRYMAGLTALPVALCAIALLAVVGKKAIISIIFSLIAQPTRYEQGQYLLDQRWNNLLFELLAAAAIAAAIAALAWAYRRNRLSGWMCGGLLILLFIADTSRINNKFMFLVPVPVKAKGNATPAMEFIAKDSNQYRTLPANSIDPMQFAAHNIPVMFTSNPVQKQRWQEILDIFSFNSAVPDMLNLKYVVFSADQYRQDQSQLAGKYEPVFTSPDGGEVVLENKKVMPKAWLVASVLQVTGRESGLQILQNPVFDPRRIALVESAPPIAMEQNSRADAGSASVERYEGKLVDISAKANVNSLLVIGDKYYQGWKAFVDGRQVEVFPVNNVLRGVYLTPGTHKVEYVFDPLPFKIGKSLTLASFALFAAMLLREWLLRRKRGESR